MGPVGIVVFAWFVEIMKFEKVLWACGISEVQKVSEGHRACGVRGVCKVCGIHEV